MTAHCRSRVLSLRIILSPLVCSLWLLIFLTACATDREYRDENDRTSAESRLGLNASRNANDKASHEVFGGGDEEEEDEPIKTEKFPGTGEFINEAAARRSPPPALDVDGEINLNFEALPVQEVVQAVLGDLLGENYVIGPGVSGEVTFATAKPIGRDQILPILEMVLRWNNAALIYKNGRYNVLPVSNAVRGNLSPRLGSAASVRGYEVLAVPLEYIAAQQMQTILEPYVQEGAIVSADNARSLMVLAGTRAELSNYLRTIEIFDVDWLQGMSVAVFSLERVEVGELVPELEAIFGGEADSPLAGLFRFVPIERLNSVMVITPQPEYLDQAEQWIERLDRGGNGSAANRLYVYAVENLEAGVLADYLLDIFGGTRTSNDNGSGGNDLTAGSLGAGLEPVSLSTINEESERGTQRQNNAPGSNGDQSGVALGDTENVRITAVEETNSLLVQASPQQYDSILAAIKRLDSEPLQVLIEAHVLQVTLTEDLEYGVNYFLSNFNPGGGTDDGGGAGNPLAGGLVSSDPLANSRAGSTNAAGNTIFSITNPTGNFFQAVVSALESVSEARTISSPTLLVRNNTEASINVGQQLAIANTTFNNGLGGVGGTTASTQFIQTGTTLTVTPRVNPGGLVYMQLSQEVSSPANTTGPNMNPNINTNILTTDVAVQSGQSIILGGLISETYSETDSGIPFLRRIPLLGKVFSNTDYDVDRNEIVIIIKPTVIEAIDKLQDVSDDLRKNFQGLKPFTKASELPNEKISKDFPEIGN